MFQKVKTDYTVVGGLVESNGLGSLLWVLRVDSVDAIWVKDLVDAGEINIMKTCGL